ncbi:MAG: hypothetical protein ACK4I8_04875 [Armatimonadota bacterium]
MKAMIRGKTAWMVTLALMAVSFAYAGAIWQLDAKSALRWRAMPTWLGNSSPNAKVEATEEGLRFFVPEAGKGMKWLIPARWINTQRFRYLVVRYRARGLNTKSHDYFIWVNDGSRRPDETLKFWRCCKNALPFCVNTPMLSQATIASR